MRRLFLFVGAFVAIAGACRADGDDKGFIVLPGMVDSIAYDAYDAHPLLGQTLRSSPEGTLPYGATRYRFGPGPEEARRAAEELTNPIPADADALERGKRAFDTFCVVCHGPGGQGDGPIIGRFPNPPSLLAGSLKARADGHFFHVITHGSGIMAPYALQIPADDRWRIVHYVRKLQGGEAASATTAAGGQDAAGGAGGAGEQSDAGGRGGGGDHAGGAGGGGGRGGTDHAGGETGVDEGADAPPPDAPDAPPAPPVVPAPPAVPVRPAPAPRPPQPPPGEGKQPKVPPPAPKDEIPEGI